MCVINYIYYTIVVSFVGREIQLTKDYTTGNATFKQGSRGTVIEATVNMFFFIFVFQNSIGINDYMTISGIKL